MSLKAPITNISRCSLHDGPGIRTVVYFKGCGLHCKWCHNPETISMHKQVLYYGTKCIHCGKCVQICPAQHKISGNNMIFSKSGCTVCGKCVEACPALALTLCGEDKTTQVVFDEIKKDSHYFAESGGGVTFSGGECLLHSDFVKELAEKCKASGINTAIESALFIPWKNIEKVIPFTDLFFADLKIADPLKHKQFTGQDNELIIDNIRRLSQCFGNIILRIPIIPTVNDTETAIEDFAAVIKGFGKGVGKIELLRYNTLAESKYTIAGKEYTKFSNTTQDDETMKTLANSLENKCGLECFFV